MPSPYKQTNQPNVDGKVMWAVLLYLCCSYWLMNKAVLASGLAEGSQAGNLNRDVDTERKGHISLPAPLLHSHKTPCLGLSAPAQACEGPCAEVCSLRSSDMESQTLWGTGGQARVKLVGGTGVPDRQLGNNKTRMQK